MLFHVTQPIWALRLWGVESLCTECHSEKPFFRCKLPTYLSAPRTGVLWRYPAVLCARPVVQSRKKSATAMLSMFLRKAPCAWSLTSTVWSSEPTTGTGKIHRRCARRVVSTCLRRHALLSKRKKTPQRFSIFGLSAQNANSLLKRL